MKPLLSTLFIRGLECILICAVGMAFGQTITTSKTAAEGIIHTTQLMKPLEPLDIPAIQDGRDCDKDPIEICGKAYCTNQEIDNKCKHAWTPRWTCADTERILEHSESGKYWCRKVQP